MVLCAVTLAIVLIVVDRTVSETAGWWAYAGGPEGATAALTTIASSMITFTGLVFSILVVALQLTSSQFSPRALGSFLRDRVAQVALGVFVSTFAYSFTALIATRQRVGDTDGYVPALTVTAAFVLVAASIAMFVQLIDHTAQSLRVVSIIDRVARESRRTMDALYPAEEEGEERGGDERDRGDGSGLTATRSSGPVTTVAARTAGVVTFADLTSMAAIAARLGVVVEVVPRTGGFVCQGAPLLRVHGDARVDHADIGLLLRSIEQGPEPTMAGDLGFGLRQLVDIAERSLSPGINDPTTAVQCLDRIHDLLRTLTARPVPTCHTARTSGQVRVWQPAPSYDDVLGLALDEIRHWGSSSLQVQRRLEAVLEDLLDIVDRPDRRASLLRQRRLLVARLDDLPASERSALTTDGRR